MITDKDISAAYRTIPNRWAKASFGIFVPDPNGNQKLFGVGTGFAAKVAGQRCIVTAQHVLDNIAQQENAYLKYVGGGINMKELCFRSLLPADLAYAPLNAVQIQFLEIAGRDLFYDPSPIEGVVPLGLHFLVGYPNSRNKVHMPRALANLGNSGHCITLPIGTPIDLNHVDKSRALMHFKFDNRELHLSSSLGAAQFSKFSGLSGSPVSELTCGKSLSGGITFGARLVGVLTEFSQQTKIITVEPISSLLCPA